MKNKKKRKGFTLIELLAVIIVLAIIALIATPIIFNVIENAKIKSLENSCYGVIDAVRTNYSENLLNSTRECKDENDKNCGGKIETNGNVEELTVAGEQPSGGSWVIVNDPKTENGRGIQITDVTFDSMKGYFCSNDLTTGKVKCEKDDANPTLEPIQATVEIGMGTNKSIEEYFTFTKTGRGASTLSCKEGNTQITNVSALALGDHVVKCIATKTSNGKTSAEKQVTIKVKDVFTLGVDNSGANKPVLYTNMIPVVYDGTKWLYSDGTQTNWYNYTDKQWANAVVLNSGVTKNVGDEVTEEEISLWYVWIPRYKYTIFNGNNGSAAAQLINVTFESGVSRTGTVTCTDNADGSETCSTITNGTSTYTHPAFTFGSTELTGFWVGKFEVSGSTSAITVKPNVTSLRGQTVSSFFTAIQKVKTTYGINNADSHMMKNMEWGAVAYLKQSQYGLGTTYMAVNDNSIYYTGGGISDAYKTNVAQSTTGNEYGVYDMSGGAFEYVMGNMKNSGNAFYSSNAGFTTAPDAKYYDSYKYDTSYTSHARGKLGDATKETLTAFGFTYGGWYSDYTTFSNSSYSWFLRGGHYSNGTYAGVFYFNSNKGNAFDSYSARAVLSAQ